MFGSLKGWFGCEYTTVVVLYEKCVILVQLCLV